MSAGRLMADQRFAHRSWYLLNTRVPAATTCAHVGVSSSGETAARALGD
jgi:hypothetical protein